jgi:transcriptional regulator with XRE-family HTH domain
VIFLGDELLIDIPTKQEEDMNLRLKMAILESGITQRQLAKKTGIHESLISMAVNGKYNFDARQKTRVAKALGRRETKLFEGIEINWDSKRKFVADECGGADG